MRSRFSVSKIGIMTALMLSFSWVLFAGTATASQATDAFSKNYPTAKFIFNNNKDIPSAVYDIHAAVPGKTADEKALRFVNEWGHMFGMNNAGYAVEHTRTMNLRYVAIVEFQQMAAPGVPVLGATVKVVVKNDKVERLTQSLVPRAEKMSVTPAVNAKTAVQSVFATKYMIPAAYDTKRLVESTILAVDGYHPDAPLVWVTNIRMKELGPYNLYVFTNAKTGKLHRVYNHVLFEKQVNAFINNPGADGANVAQTVTVNRLDLTEGDDQLASEWLFVLGCPDNGETIAVSYSGYSFNVPVCSEIAQAAEDEHSDFLYQPYIESDNNNNSPYEAAESRDDLFAEAHSYYHVDNFYAWMQELGVVAAGEEGTNPFEGLNKKPFGVTVNFKMPNIAKLMNPQAPGDNLVAFDNAFFMPGGDLFPGYSREDSIVLGQGTDIDLSYDAEIIYHEFTHAVIDTMISMLGDTMDEYGAVVDPGAINEGFADFFSSVYSGDSHMADYAGSRLGGEDGEIAMRELDNELVCPGYMWGEVHQDSMHFSGALWDMYQALHDTETDNTQEIMAAVISGIAQLGQQPSFTEAGNAVLSAIEDAFGADAKAAAAEAFAGHVVVDCPRYLAFPNELSFKKDLMVLPSRDSFGLDKAPGYMQLSVNVPEDHNQILVGFYRPITSQQMSALDLRVVVKKGSPVQFGYSSGRVSHDGDWEIRFYKLSSSDRAGYEQYRATIQAPNGGEWPGAGEYYMALLNYSSSGGGMAALTGGIETAVDTIVFSMYNEPPQPDGDQDIVAEEEIVEETVEDGDITAEEDGDIEDIVVEEEVADTVDTVVPKPKSSSDGCLGGSASFMGLGLALLAISRRRRRR